MNKFQNDLLIYLLEKYERHAFSWDKNKTKRTISLDVEKSPLFKNYVDAKVSYLFINQYEKDIKELIELHFINVKRDKNTGQILKIIFLDESYERCNELLNRIPQNDIYFTYQKTIENLKKGINSPVSIKFLEYLEERISSHQPFSSYLKDFNDLPLYIEMINKISFQDEEILLRVFSKKNFKDSKLIERNESKLLKLFNDFDIRDYKDFEELLSEHNIVKIKGPVVVKNGLTFKINNQTISLDDLNEEFYFSLELLEKMEILNISKKKVITIENLTTFYTFNDDSFVVIYLGGFHNRVRRLLIEKIFAFNPNLDFYHFGDIDYGGFEILLDLRNKTNINFQPYMMSVDELKRYKDECLSLTENDKRRLESLLENGTKIEFNDVISYMLENDIKLEQESIEL